MTLGRSALAGAADGALATGAMSGVMWVARKMGALGAPPPRTIARAALRRVGVRPRRPAVDLAAVALHLAFGAAAGLVFRAGREAAGRPPSTAVAEGLAFGALVWGASYAGWIPALGILPPPSRDRPGRPTSMLAAHAVYGAVLGARARRA